MAEYEKQAWVNGSSSTPLSAERLNHIEEGVHQASLDAAGAVQNSPEGRQALAESTEVSSAIARVAAWAKNPDTLISGSITRNSDQAVTSADVVWPDGTPGTFTADTLSTAFPGAIDGYHITYGSPVQKTFTQPAITRNAAGAATNVPQIVVS